jgi:hypothetical protein
MMHGGPTSQGNVFVNPTNPHFVAVSRELPQECHIARIGEADFHSVERRE